MKKTEHSQLEIAKANQAKWQGQAKKMLQLSYRV